MGEMGWRGEETREEEIQGDTGGTPVPLGEQRRGIGEERNRRGEGVEGWVPGGNAS